MFKKENAGVAGLAILFLFVWGITAWFMHKICSNYTGPSVVAEATTETPVDFRPLMESDRVASIADSAKPYIDFAWDTTHSWVIYPVKKVVHKKKPKKAVVKKVVAKNVAVVNEVVCSHPIVSSTLMWCGGGVPCNTCTCSSCGKSWKCF